MADDDLTLAAVRAAEALIGLALRSVAALGSGVTLAQYQVLECLESHGPSRTLDIAADLDQSPASVSEACERLIADGLAARTRSLRDERILVISSTPAGRELVEHVLELRRADVRRQLSLIPKDSLVGVAAASTLLVRTFGPEYDEAGGLVRNEGQATAANRTRRVPHRRIRLHLDWLVFVAGAVAAFTCLLPHGVRGWSYGSGTGGSIILFLSSFFYGFDRLFMSRRDSSAPAPSAILMAVVGLSLVIVRMTTNPDGSRLRIHLAFAAGVVQVGCLVALAKPMWQWLASSTAFRISSRSRITNS